MALKKKGLQVLAEDLRLSNVLFHDPVSKEKIAEYISILDIALVPLKKRDTFKTVIPSKIFEMASMQKPILLGVEGQAQEIIEKYQAGLCFEPENREDFIEKLLEMKNNKDLYKTLQEGCCKLAKDYDRKQLAANMLQKLEAAIK